MLLKIYKDIKDINKILKEHPERAPAAIAEESASLETHILERLGEPSRVSNCTRRSLLCRLIDIEYTGECKVH